MKLFLYPVLIIALFSSCLNEKKDDKIVNAALEGTNKRFAERNNRMYSQLEIAMMNDEKATKPIYNKALTLKKETAEFYIYLQNIKDGRSIQSNADELKTSMEKYYEHVFALVPPDELKIFQANFPSQDCSTASTIMLSKFQNDVLSFENDVLTTLVGQTQHNDLKFDELKVLVVPKSTSVHAGEKYEASIYLAAINSTSSPGFFLGDVDEDNNAIISKIDSTSVHAEQGMGKYEILCSKTGVFSLSGIVTMKKSDGTCKAFPFKTQYEVVK